jgi:hypothetical protein
MKRKSLIVILALVGILLMTGASNAGSFNMVGNVLTVGIDNSGGLVNLTGVGFPVNGQGITLNPPVIANDFTAPGTPWEFYSLGVNGATLVGGVNGVSSNPIGLNTVNNSAGNLFKADSNGPAIALGGALLSYDQSVAFDTNSNVIKFKADIFNVGNTTATNVVYARGFDPDPDSVSSGYAGAAYATNNSILGPGSVMAVGPVTGLFGKIDDVSGGGVASISGSAPAFPWETNPYVLAGGGLVNGALAGNPFDYSINMAWLVGDIAPGASVEIDWNYTFGVVPVPPSLILLGSGLLGLVGLRFRGNRA